MNRRTAIGVGVVSATVTYMLGLVAPLTPSEGVPDLWELLVFLALPCVVLAVCAYAAQSRVAKALLVAQLFLFGGFGSWLLYFQLSTS
jgi:hypothetical protein